MNSWKRKDPAGTNGEKRFREVKNWKRASKSRKKKIMMKRKRRKMIFLIICDLFIIKSNLYNEKKSQSITIN